MLIDRGFSYMIAKEVLKDNPNNKEALKRLMQPENIIVYNNGTVVDLSEINEEVAIYEGLKSQMIRMTII
jgi:hypothetical protein